MRASEVPSRWTRRGAAVLLGVLAMSGSTAALAQAPAGPGEEAPLELEVTAYAGVDLAYARAAQQLIDHGLEEAGATAPAILAPVDGGRSRLLADARASQAVLRQRIDEHVREDSKDSNEALAAALADALGDFERVRAAQEAAQEALRGAVAGSATLLRDTAVTAYTAFGGPQPGAVVAEGTRLLDDTLAGWFGGEPVYRSTRGDDLANIASTWGAVRAGGVAHHLTRGLGIDTTTAAGRARDLALHTGTHFGTDVAIETAGQVAGDVMARVPAEQVWHNARAAVGGAGGASLVSSFLVEYLEANSRMDRETLVAVAETLERVFAKTAVRAATGGSRHGGDAPEVSFDAWYFADQEYRTGQRFGDDVPGLRMARRVNGLAAAAGVLPRGADGRPRMVADRREAALTLGRVLDTLSPEGAHRLVRDLADEFGGDPGPFTCAEVAQIPGFPCQPAEGPLGARHGSAAAPTGPASMPPGGATPLGGPTRVPPASPAPSVEPAPMTAVPRYVRRAPDGGLQPVPAPVLGPVEATGRAVGDSLHGAWNRTLDIVVPETGPCDDPSMRCWGRHEGILLVGDGSP